MHLGCFGVIGSETQQPLLECFTAVREFGFEDAEHGLPLEAVIFTTTPAQHGSPVDEEFEVEDCVGRVGRRDAVGEPELAVGVGGDVDGDEGAVGIDEGGGGGEGVGGAGWGGEFGEGKDVELRDEGEGYAAVGWHFWTLPLVGARVSGVVGDG